MQPYSLELMLKDDSVLLLYSSIEADMNIFSKLFAAILACEMRVSAASIDTEDSGIKKCRFLLSQVDATSELKKAVQILKKDLTKLFTEGLDISMYISSHPEVFFDFALSADTPADEHLVKVAQGKSPGLLALKLSALTKKSFFFDLCTMLQMKEFEFSKLQAKREQDLLHLRADIILQIDQEVSMSDLYNFEDEIRNIL